MQIDDFDPEEDHVKPFIHETRKVKSLHFSIAEVQSSMDLAHPDALALVYTRTMMGFLLFHPAPLRIGMIGLGGGSLAKFCYRHLPRGRHHRARDQPARHRAAPRVLGARGRRPVPGASRRRRALRRAHEGLFDVLLVDGYDSDGLPGVLSSKRFYNDVFDCLRPGGVMAANIHLVHEEFTLLLARVGRSFGAAPLAVKDHGERQRHRVRAQGRPAGRAAGRGRRAAGDRGAGAVGACCWRRSNGSARPWAPRRRPASRAPREAGRQGRVAAPGLAEIGTMPPRAASAPRSRGCRRGPPFHRTSP